MKDPWKSQAIVAVDANVLVWMTKEVNHRTGGKDSPNLKEMQERAGHLLDELLHERVRIILPSVVVCEYLAGILIENQPKALAGLYGQFEIYSFDPPAMAEAARLAVLRSKEHPPIPGQRQAIKSDTYAVAIAKVRRASIFYSNDKGCRRVAELAGLEARDLPTSPRYLFPMSRGMEEPTDPAPLTINDQDDLEETDASDVSA